jgi:LuxR family maltose regulon positive regulatory protein
MLGKPGHDGADRFQQRCWTRAAAGAHAPRLVDQLTGRELELLAMLARGQSSQNIAGSLFITLDTVKKHVSHVLSKLGATNRTEAVARGGPSG